MMGFIIYALVNTASIPQYAFVDAVFPVFVASVSLAAALGLMAQMMLKPENDAVFADRECDEETRQMPFGLWQTLAWFAGLLIATSIFGFIIALGGFLLLFFHYRARISPIRTIVQAIIGVMFMCGMAWTLNRDFPPGLLQHFITLPWPLG